MIVLEIFEDHPGQHFTADDVARLINERAFDVGLPTVYRILAQLTDAGLLSRLNIDWDRSCYELPHETPHGHLVCLSCRRVVEFEDTTITARQAHVARINEFEVLERQQILRGRCMDCRLQG